MKNKILVINGPNLEILGKREDFRKKSVTAGACDAVISGFGVKGYDLALEYIMNKND